MAMARVHCQCCCHQREGVGEGHVIIGERERVGTLLSIVREKAGTRVSHHHHWEEGDGRGMSSLSERG